MNIFILDTDIELNARYHCDKHVIKMITEHCQMLSTSYREKYRNGGSVPTFMYKNTHVNHPCNVWLRERLDNMIYLIWLTKALIAEYEYRYEKKDKFLRARQIIAFFENWIPISVETTPFVRAMPDECKVSASAVECYRLYYMTHKQRMAAWKKREVPAWYLIKNKTEICANNATLTAIP